MSRPTRIVACALLAAAIGGCRGDESEVIIDGLAQPCVVLTLVPQTDTVAVGDSVRVSLHPTFGPECADATREIEWSLSDTTAARLGPVSDSSAFVVGTRPGVTTLRADAVADRTSAGGAQITVVRSQPGA